MASPHLEIRPVQSTSPEAWRRGVSPKYAPTLLERGKRLGSSIAAQKAKALIAPIPGHGHETTALITVPGQGQQLAGETSDLPAHNLVHGKQGANGYLQKPILANQLFSPAAEDIATRLRNDETMVLE